MNEQIQHLKQSVTYWRGVVRGARAELHEAGRLTDDEYADLCQDTAARDMIDSIDMMRDENADMRVTLEKAEPELKKLKGFYDEIVSTLGDDLALKRIRDLTAQQTADAAAHRELKREHNETLDVLLSLRNSCDDALYQRDTARAESAKLRVVLGKVTAALLRVQNWYACDGSISTCHSAFDGTNEALALAATVLKEGKV